MGPSKKCWFWGNGPSTKAPQIPLRHQKTFHLALFLSNLAILKSAALFQGLNWPPKAEKKLIGALSCMHKGPKCIQSLWDYPKKFLLCKSTKKARYVRSLGKNPIFTYRAFFVLLHKRNFFRMVPEGLNAFGTFVHAAESAR